MAASRSGTDRGGSRDERGGKDDAVRDNRDSDKLSQEAVDVEREQGFRGIEVDETPNENYTLAGVNSGKPTPETDDKLAREVAGKRFEQSLLRD